MLNDRVLNPILATILTTTFLSLEFNAESRVYAIKQKTLKGTVLKVSNNGKLALVYDSSDGDSLTLARVPTLNSICQLSHNQILPVKRSTFSPNDNFLLIDFEYSSNVSVPVRHTKRISWKDQGFVYSKSYDLEKCQEIEGFAELFSTYKNEFSSESEFIYIAENRVFKNAVLSKPGAWRFNLNTKLVEGYKKEDSKVEKNCSFFNRQCDYQIIRDRQGRIAIKKEDSIIQIFQSKSSNVIREVHIIEDGKTISISQKNMTTFIDIETQRAISIPRRVYAFDNSSNTFIASNTRNTIAVYKYPSFEKKCDFKDIFFNQYSVDNQISPDITAEFSPDNRFLAINTDGISRPDSHYPSYPTGLRSQISHSVLFDLVLCNEVKNFSNRHTSGSGNFSSDSKFFYDNTMKIIDDRTYAPTESWLFDLVDDKFIR